MKYAWCFLIVFVILLFMTIRAINQDTVQKRNRCLTTCKNIGLELITYNNKTNTCTCTEIVGR